MAQVKCIINQLKELGLESYVACPIWTIEDVIEQAKHDNRVITKDDAENILDEIHSKHDAELGITWETIRCYLEEYPTLEDIIEQRLDSEIDRMFTISSEYEEKYNIKACMFIESFCSKLLKEIESIKKLRTNKVN